MIERVLLLGCVGLALASCDGTAPKTLYPDPTCKGAPVVDVKMNALADGKLTIGLSQDPVYTIAGNQHVLWKLTSGDAGADAVFAGPDGSFGIQAKNQQNAALLKRASSQVSMFCALVEPVFPDGKKQLLYNVVIVRTPKGSAEKGTTWICDPTIVNESKSGVAPPVLPGPIACRAD